MRRKSSPKRPATDLAKSTESPFADYGENGLENSTSVVYTFLFSLLASSKSIALQTARN